MLGAGESGKSTFLKQMRIIHGYRFGHDEVDEYRETIYKNIVMGMKVSLCGRVRMLFLWYDLSVAFINFLMIFWSHWHWGYALSTVVMFDWLIYLFTHRWFHTCWVNETIGRPTWPHLYPIPWFVFLSLSIIITPYVIPLLPIIKIMIIKL